MIPIRSVFLAALLLVASSGVVGAAEPTVGFNSWTNLPGVVEGTINVHALTTSLPKPPFGFVDYLPKGYNSGDSLTKWPVVFALLGAAEQGDGTDTAANGHQLLAKMTGNGPLANVVAQHWDFPCIVISPQSSGPWTNPNAIKAMVDYVKANYRVDATRLYMTGYVDGAAGALRFATAFPNVLAGLIPIEPTYGPTTSAEVGAVQQLPMWMVQCFSDQALNRRNAIAWVDQATRAETGLTSDAMATYPGYGSINHYACDSDPATGMPLAPAGPTTTVPNAKLTTGSATVALPVGNLIANTGSFYIALWGGEDAAPFTRVTFGADLTSYVVKSVGPTGITLTHPYTGPALTADAHITTPNGLVMSGFYQPTPAAWAWYRAPANVPGNATDTRILSMFWQYDRTVAVAGTWQNGQVWDWLFGHRQGMPAATTVTLSGLAATYDGAPHAVVATTTPANLATAITYDGSVTVPTAAGSYAVVATVTDPNRAGSASGTLIIAKANATAVISNTAVTYDGLPHAVVVTTTPAGLPNTVRYDSSALAPVPVNAGVHAVEVTITDQNYSGTTQGQLAIAAADVSIVLTAPSVTYDGAVHLGTVVTTPPGVPCSVSYLSSVGSTALPRVAGTYTVDARAIDPNYRNAVANAVMVIARATATITMPDATITYGDSLPVIVATTNPPGIATDVSIDSAGQSGLAGVHTVTATVRSDEQNYIGKGTSRLTILPAPATVTLSNLTVPYDGNGHLALVTTTPIGLTTSTTYDGVNFAPAAIGAYAVVATVTDPNHVGSATGTLVITSQEPTVSANAWTNTPGVTEGTIATCPVDTTLPRPPLGYVVYLPKGYNQADATTTWPIVVYLPDIGESGDGTSNAINQYQLYRHMVAHGPLYQIVTARWDFPAIVIAPQPAVNWNSTNSIKAELEYAKAHYRVDVRRVYLTGQGDGASGVLRYSATYPNDPAGIVPIEAAALPGTGQTAAMKSIPTWAAHCFADPGLSARTLSVAWVDGSTGADAGLPSDCMANYPGYGLTPRTHYACDIDLATGFPLQPKGMTTWFSGASLTSASTYGAFNATVGSSMYLMWSGGSDAKPFATVNVADGSATADYWAKAGVMIRDSTAPGAKYAMICQMPNDEVRFQWRSQTDGNVDFINFRFGGNASVKYLRLTRSRGGIWGEYSEDNVLWKATGALGDFFSNPTITTGLAVTARDNSRTYSQTFSNVLINEVAPGTLSDADVGTAGDPGIPGSASVAAGVYTVTGGGSDIADTADHFHYAYQAASGDVTITARVGINPTLYNLTTVYPTGFYMSKKYAGATATVPITVTTPVGYNATGSFDPVTGWAWARDQHWDHGRPGRHVMTMFWYQDRVQGWRETWSNTEVWNWLFTQVHP